MGNGLLLFQISPGQSIHSLPLISVDSILQIQHRSVSENENLSAITDYDKGNLSTMAYDITMCV